MRIHTQNNFSPWETLVLREKRSVPGGQAAAERGRRVEHSGEGQARAGGRRAAFDGTAHDNNQPGSIIGMPALGLRRTRAVARFRRTDGHGEQAVKPCRARYMVM